MLYSGCDPHTTSLTTALVGPRRGACHQMLCCKVSQLAKMDMNDLTTQAPFVTLHNSDHHGRSGECVAS